MSASAPTLAERCAQGRHALRDEAAVLAAAQTEAALVGLPYVTKAAIARRLNVSPGTVSNHAGDIARIKRKVAQMDGLSDYGLEDRYAHARAERDAGILAAALELAAAGNYRDLTRAAVAQAAGVSPGTVSNYAGDMDGLRAKVMVEAVRSGAWLGVVAQGLAARDPIALAAPEAVRTAALATLACLPQAE